MSANDRPSSHHRTVSGLPTVAVTGAWLLLLVLVGTVASTASVSAQVLDPNYSLRIEQKCEIGPDVVARISMDNAGTTVAGWSFGVCHDGSVLDVIAVDNGSTTATVNNGAPPAFQGYQFAPVPGTGFTVAAVIDLTQNLFLPVGNDYHLYDVTYGYKVAPGPSTSIVFCDSLATPTVPVLVTLSDSVTGVFGVIPETSGDTLAPLTCFCEEEATYAGPRIDFELAPLGPVGAATQALFAADGVFVTVLSGGVEVMQSTAALTSVSGSRLLGNPTGITFVDGLVEFDFAIPATGADAVVDGVSFALISDGLGTATVTAYDSSNQVVDTQMFSGLPDQRQWVNVYGLAIDRVEINLDASGSRFGIDDFCFNDPFDGSQPPSIVDPVPASVCVGDPHTFEVVADSTAPLSYQWFFAGNPLSGATASTLTIPMVTLADAGEYWCEISGFFGVVTSGSAMLTVLSAPQITTQPVGGEFCDGDDVTLMAAATGDNLSYQWRLDGLDIPGATTNVLSLTNVSVADSGDYDVTVSGTCLPAVSSDTVTVTVGSAVITQQPSLTNPTTCDGETVNLSVTADGAGVISYQWRLDGQPIPGATMPTFQIATLTPQDAGTYDVVVSNFCGDVTSDAITLPDCPFVRGDCNGDGGFNIGDAVCTLALLFSGGTTTCRDAVDSNDDASVNIADAVFSLAALFSAGPMPMAPFPDCGADPTADDVDCEGFAPCQ